MRVGWAKARSAVSTIHHRSRFLMVGTLSLCPPCTLIRNHAVRDRYWLSATAATTTAATASTTAAAGITQRLVLARIEVSHVAQ
jgi:hypothetical protein